MKKFVYIYYGGGKPDNLSMEEVMSAWQKWYGELGEKLVDGGNPFNDGAREVTNQGVHNVDTAPSVGYTIVNAESMDEAVELSKGCPMLAHHPDTAKIQVYEALPM